MNDYVIVLIIYLMCVGLGTIVFRWLDPEKTTYFKALKFMSIGFAIGISFIGVIFLIIGAIMGE